MRNRVDVQTHAGEQQHVVLFDGECNLCDSSVQFIIKHDAKHQFRFMSLQSGEGQSLLQSSPAKSQQDIVTGDSVVLVQADKVYTKSTAALRIVRQLDYPWRLLYVFIVVPKPIRDVCYGVVARNRYRWFGKKASSCSLPSATRLERKRKM